MEPEVFTSDSSAARLACLGESGLAVAAATSLSAGSGLATAAEEIGGPDQVPLASPLLERPLLLAAAQAPAGALASAG